MRFGICAPYQDVADWPSLPFDYLEENVQRFLQPEESREVFEASWHAARKLFVPIEAANSLLPATLPIVATAAQPVDEPRLERYIKTALQRADQVGMRVLVFGSGSARMCPPDVRVEDAVQQIGEHFAQWCEWAKGYGVEIVLEPLRYKETNTLNTVNEAGELVTRLADSGAKLLADTYHMACNDEAPTDVIQWGPLLSHVHVAEKRDRAAPGYYGENFRPYFAALHTANYDRRISIECRWHDLASEAASGIAWIKKQWEQA